MRARAAMTLFAALLLYGQEAARPPVLLKDWKPPEVAAYKGAHGLRLPKAAWER